MQIGLRAKLLSFFPTNLYRTDSNPKKRDYEMKEVRAAWGGRKSTQALNSDSYVTNFELTFTLCWIKAHPPG